MTTPLVPVIEIRHMHWPDCENPFAIWMVIGNQSFPVGIDRDDLHEAVWYAQQLHTAFERLGIAAEIRQIEIGKDGGSNEA